MAEVHRMLRAVMEAPAGTRSDPRAIPPSDPSDPLGRAVTVAAAADRVAVAMAAGYRAALTALLPAVEGVVALAATEAGGAHPRAIETTLRPEGDGVRLVGTKTFVTMGGWADRAVVLGSAGEHDGRKRLRCAVVPLDVDGVTLHEGPPLPLIPEIPHAAVELDVHLSGSAVLEGDGWTDVVRPFRTVEDLHVAAAVAAYGVGACRRGGGRPDALLATLATARALCDGPWDDPAVHLALQGLLDEVQRATDAVDWSAVGAEEADRWSRDRSVLQVASKARKKRAEVARAALA